MAPLYTIRINTHAAMVSSHWAQAIYVVALKPTILIYIVVLTVFYHRLYQVNTIAARLHTIQVSTRVARVFFHWAHIKRVAVKKLTMQIITRVARAC